MCQEFNWAVNTRYHIPFSGHDETPYWGCNEFRPNQTWASLWGGSGSRRGWSCRHAWTCGALIRSLPGALQPVKRRFRVLFKLNIETSTIIEKEVPRQFIQLPLFPAGNWPGSENITHMYRWLSREEYSQISTHLPRHGRCTSSPLQTFFFAGGCTRRPGVVALPSESHFFPPEQLMTQKFYPTERLSARTGGVTSPWQPGQPLRGPSVHQSMPGVRVTPPCDLAVEVICCRRNRVLVFHDLGCSLALKMLLSPVINWTARDIRHGEAVPFRFIFHLWALKQACPCVDASPTALTCV